MSELNLGHKIYQIIQRNLPEAASVHSRAFPKSALTRLGREAVRRYYDWLLTGPHDCLAAGAFDGDRLVGFIFAGKFRGALTGYVRKNRVYLAWRVLTHPWLVFNPIFTDRLKLGLRVLRNKPAPSAANETPKKPAASFGVLAIAVDPNAHKTGIGTSLMIYAEQAAREQGFQRMHLTVEPENTNAVRFYEHLGWEKVPHESPWHGRMEKIFQS